MQNSDRAVDSTRVFRGMNGWVQVLAVIFDVMMSHHTMACWHNAALDRHAQDTVHLQVQVYPLGDAICCLSDPTLHCIAGAMACRAQVTVQLPMRMLVLPLCLAVCTHADLLTR